MSVQPAPWPQPSPQIAAAVGRMDRGRRAPLAVVVRDELGELYADEAFAAAFGVRGAGPAGFVTRAVDVGDGVAVRGASDRSAGRRGGTHQRRAR
jgi:hypothetical protein